MKEKSIAQLKAQVRQKQKELQFIEGELNKLEDELREREMSSKIEKLKQKYLGKCFEIIYDNYDQDSTYVFVLEIIDDVSMSVDYINIESLEKKVVFKGGNIRHIWQMRSEKGVKVKEISKELFDAKCKEVVELINLIGV